MESATSVTSSDDRAKLARTLPARLRPPSRSDSFRSLRDIRKAGSSPKNSAEANDTATVNHSTRSSIAISSRRGISGGAKGNQSAQAAIRDQQAG